MLLKYNLTERKSWTKNDSFYAISATVASCWRFLQPVSVNTYNISRPFIVPVRRQQYYSSVQNFSSFFIALVFHSLLFFGPCLGSASLPLFKVRSAFFFRMIVFHKAFLYQTSLLSAFSLLNRDLCCFCWHHRRRGYFPVPIEIGHRPSSKIKEEREEKNNRFW